MPNIEVPKINRNLGLDLSDRAASSSVQAGRRIAQQYNEAGAAYTELGRVSESAIERAGGAYVRYEESREISRGAVEMAKLQAQLTQDWNERAKKADPNDPSVGPEFHERTLNPSLEEFQSAFNTEGGRKWAEQRIDALRNHMFQKTSADMATLAGHAAVVNATQLVNAHSTTVKDDPSSVFNVMASYRADVAAVAKSSPNLTPELAGRMQEEVTQRGLEMIAKSAVFGAIQRNPDEGLKLAQHKDLLPYLNGPEVKQFEAYAQSQKRLAEHERREEKRFQKEQREEKNEETVGSFLLRLNSKDQSPPTREEINRAFNAGEMTLRGYEHLTRILDHPPNVKLPPGVAETNAVDLIMKIRGGEITSMDPIYKAMGDGQIDYQRFKQVQQEFRELQTDDGTPLSVSRNRFMRDYGSVVNPLDAYGQRHPSGYIKQFQLERYAREREAELRKGGKDPNDLYNPNSPEFLGKTPYAQPMSAADMHRETLDKMRPNATPAERPDWLGEFKAEAQYDSAAKRWYVIRGGKKMWVNQ